MIYKTERNAFDVTVILIFLITILKRLIDCSLFFVVERSSKCMEKKYRSLLIYSRHWQKTT